MEMASFRQHGNGWQARVRRKGTPDQTKSFVSLQEVQGWARSVEIEIDRGSYVDTSNAQKITTAELIETRFVCICANWRLPAALFGPLLLPP